MRAFLSVAILAVIVDCSAGPSAGTTGGGSVADAGVDAMPICEFVIRTQDPSCPELPNAIITHCPDGGPCLFVACAPGFADCNNQLDDGCEINIGNDPNNCGECHQVCPDAIGACVDMKCQ